MLLEHEKGVSRWWYIYWWGSMNGRFGIFGRRLSHILLVVIWIQSQALPWAPMVLHYYQTAWIIRVRVIVSVVKDPILIEIGYTFSTHLGCQAVCTSRSMHQGFGRCTTWIRKELDYTLLVYWWKPSRLWFGWSNGGHLGSQLWQDSLQASWT